MSKILASMPAIALAAVLALPANAAERRAVGLKSNDPAAQTEFSSVYRSGYRRYGWGGYGVRRAWWGPRYGYYGWGRPWRYGYYGWRRPWLGGYYGGYGYPYYGGYYRPWYRPFPVVSIGFGFGPRWWW